MNLKYINKKNILSVTIGVFILVSFSLIYFYNSARAFINPIYTNVTANKTDVSANSNSCTYLSDSGSAINLVNSYPVSDNVGMSTAPYEFTIGNGCDNITSSKIYLVVNKETTVNLDTIKFNLNDGTDAYYDFLTNQIEYDFSDNYTDYECDGVNDYGSSKEYCGLLEEYEKTTGNTDVQAIYYLGSSNLGKQTTRNLKLNLWIDSESEVSNGEIFNANIVVGDDLGTADTNFSQLILLNNAEKDVVEYDYDTNTDVVVKECNNNLSHITSCIKDKGSAYASDIKGLYPSVDDFGDTYYFFKDVENNYVSFAGYMWRIIRIDGNNNIKIVLDISDNYSYQRPLAINNPTNELRGEFLNYTYTIGNATGNENSNFLKTATDNWYEDHILANENYKKYVVDGIFCGNESNELKRKTRRRVCSYIPMLNIEFNCRYIYDYHQDYAGFGILELENSFEYNNYSEASDYKCLDSGETYTTENFGIGNGYLSYPVAPLSYSEVKMANLPGESYLAFDNSYWLINPSIITSSKIDLKIVTDANELSSMTLGSNYNTLTYAPSLYLNGLIPNVIGDGTRDNPYQIIEE